MVGENPYEKLEASEGARGVENGGSVQRPEGAGGRRGVGGGGEGSLVLSHPGRVYGENGVVSGIIVELALGERRRHRAGVGLFNGGMSPSIRKPPRKTKTQLSSPLVLVFSVFVRDNRHRIKARDFDFDLGMCV